MNGFDSETLEPSESGRDFVPFDTYSFGILEAGPSGPVSPSLPDAPPRRPPVLHVSARLLPDLLESDLAEALRQGASDGELGGLLMQSSQVPNPPRVQTLQLPELSPLDPGEAYHFELPMNEEPPDLPQPSVDVQKDGDRVEKISIHCTCGEVIHLDCVY